MMENQIPSKPPTLNTVSSVFFVMRYVVWGAIILAGCLMANLNAGPVNLNYFWGTVSLSLSVVVLCTFALGYLLGIGMNVVNHIRLSIYNRRFEKRYQALEKEIFRLKKDFSPDRKLDLLSSSFPASDLTTKQD